MRCPYCKETETVVKDSRDTDDNNSIRRRRHCQCCNGRFTTFEKVQIRELSVVKRTGLKRPFDRSKIINSLTTATRKRDFSIENIEKIADKIVLEVQSLSTKEVTSRKIGKIIMQELAKIDPVAYIRFASVYKDFTSAQDFAKFINKL